MWDDNLGPNERPDIDPSIFHITSFTNIIHQRQRFNGGITCKRLGRSVFLDGLDKVEIGIKVEVGHEKFTVEVNREANDLTK